MVDISYLFDVLCHDFVERLSTFKNIEKSNNEEIENEKNYVLNYGKMFSEKFSKTLINLMLMFSIHTKK